MLLQPIRMFLCKQIVIWGSNYPPYSSDLAPWTVEKVWKVENFLPTYSVLEAAEAWFTVQEKILKVHSCCRFVVIEVSSFEESEEESVLNNKIFCLSNFVYFCRGLNFFPYSLLHEHKCIEQFFIDTQLARWPFFPSSGIFCNFNTKCKCDTYFNFIFKCI